ncbi:MAG: hypothetical protein O3C40_37185 [Planctomycetota bacterium]|nr:hypothetical protein [Planctomycetota bacterium]
MLNRVGLACAFCLVAVSAGTTHAQPIPIRGRVFLPPTRGATVLSTYIDAEARRMVAVGNLLESMAIAHRINVESDREAMKNSVLWVETYFTRQELNRQYRRAADPIYIDDQQRRDEMKKRIILQQPEEALNGDVTDDLNWILDRLVTDSSTYRFIFDDREGLAAAIDRPLSSDRISHIRMRQATGQEGGGQSFRADTAQLFHPKWPRPFESPMFASERASFETARDNLLSELDAGKASFATWRESQAAHDRLTHKFNEVDSSASMKDLSGGQRIQIRGEARGFLKSLEAAIALTANAHFRQLGVAR